MASRLRTSISRNLGLWFVGLLMAGLALVFALAYRAFRQEAAEQIIDRDEHVAVLSAFRLRSDLEAFAAVLDAVARAPEITGGTDLARRAALLAAAPRLSVFDGGVIVLDDHGIVRAALTDGTPPLGTDLSNRDFFRAVLGETAMFVSDAQALVPGGDPVVAVVVPILGEANRLQGALAGLFRIDEAALSALYASIVRLRLDQTGDTSIVDGRGRIVYASDPEQIGHFLAGHLLRLISSPQQASAELSRDADGTEMVVAHAPIPRTSWTLINEAEWAVVTQSTRRYRNILFLAFGAALLLPPLVLTLVTRQRRFRFLEVRRPEEDEAWARVTRDYLHPRPWPTLPGWDLVGRCLPGKRAAHEFVDAAILPDGRLMLAAGLVAGSGLQAALTLAATRTVIRSCGQRLTMPDDSLSQCNASLCLQLEGQSEVRCTVLHLDPRTGWLDFACAGTGALEAHGRYVVQAADVGGQPMGTSPQAEFEVGRVRLERGSLLVMLGPSMAETRDAAGRPFLPESLLEILGQERQGLDDLTERVVRAFKAFNAASPLFDPDLAILVLERRERRETSG